MHVKKGDTVLVISGNDKGKQGLVRRAMPRESTLLVEGINLRWKHKKPSQQNPKGERVQRETPIHASNVKRVEAETTKKKGGSKAAAKAPAKAKSKKAPAKGDAEGS